jgi:hypothetical protein
VPTFVIDPPAQAGQALAAALGVLGWSPGPPPWMRAGDVAADRKAGTGAGCAECSKPVEVLMFHRADARQGDKDAYRAFVACVRCQTLVGF